MKLPITIELACLSILVALAIAIPAGVLAAVSRNTRLGRADERHLARRRVDPELLARDHADPARLRAAGWLPASGYVPPWEDPLDNLRRMLMPALVLGTGLAAVLMRQTRNSDDRGAERRLHPHGARQGPGRAAVIVRHALRNGLIPVVTILGLQMGALMSGAVVTEQIFVVPGFGRLIVEAVFTRDYPLVQGVVLITAAPTSSSTCSSTSPTPSSTRASGSGAPPMAGRPPPPPTRSRPPPSPAGAASG